MSRLNLDRFVTMNRRQLLKGLAGSAALTTSLPLFAGCVATHPRFGDYPFKLGIASGEPLPDGVVLWTKVAPRPFEPAPPAKDALVVHWEVAQDDRMRQIVRSGEAIALPQLDHAVHVEVDGLKPSRHYFYRFRVGNEVSPIGRTKTAPPPGAHVGHVRFGVCGCQRREDGRYTAHSHLAKEDLDFVFFTGDYIYESYWRRAKDFVALELGLKVPDVYDADQTLGYYRKRYALYKSDPELQAAHASAPFLMSWDDHEVDNNFAGETDQFGSPPELFFLRRVAAFQAYYEMMPLRRSAMPRGIDMQMYRRMVWGDLAAFNILDTRNYRSDQPCGDGRRSYQSCPEALAPDRTMLGFDQEAWLTDGLARSGARWNVLAQQVMMMQHDRSADPSTIHYHMDKWDGAFEARQRLFRAIQNHQVQNVVVLTGDIHNNWAGELKADFADPSSPVLGHEFVATSISSGGDGTDHTWRTAAILEQNPHMKFFNDQRGYLVCDVTPKSWTTHYRVVDYIRRSGAPVRTRRSFVVEADHPGLLDV